MLQFGLLHLTVMNVTATEILNISFKFYSSFFNTSFSTIDLYFLGFSKAEGVNLQMNLDKTGLKNKV